MSLSSFFPIAYRKHRIAPRICTILACVFSVTLAPLFASPPLHAQPASAPATKTAELRVAAASDLQPIMPIWIAAYEKAKGVKIVASFAASGTLTTQILNGAPFDLFLAADFTFPERIVAANLADAKAPTPYARGTLVLWARKDSPLQPITIDSLTGKRVTSLAIADQFHAPYGRAAVSALTWMKLYDRLKPHLVVGENITQTAQFVESGNAQLGLISLTTANTPHFRQIGTYVLIPTQTYPPIRQCAVILAKSDRKAAAHEFLQWLLSPEVQSHLKDFGLAPVK